MSDVVGGWLLEDPLRYGIPQDAAELGFGERSSNTIGEVVVAGRSL